VPRIAQGRIEENQRRIETAALELFTRQGFHGTNIREIAERAEVSTGAIYTYYPTKESLYLSVLEKYRARIQDLLDKLFSGIGNPFSKRDLKTFASELRTLVYGNPEYWLLMYIDVIEFKNRHFEEIFRAIPKLFQNRLGDVLEKAKEEPRWGGQSPNFVFATIYFALINYFIIEKLFQGNQHLGVSDDEAIEGMIDLFSRGLWRSQETDSSENSLSTKAGSKSQGKRGKKSRVLAMSSAAR